MSDIQKCPGALDRQVCSMRSTCRRYRAERGQVQAMFSQAPMYQLSEGGEWKCDEYWRAET